MKFLVPALVALAVTATPWNTHAQLFIGQSTGLTGPIAAASKEALAGIHLYLDSINAKGGVHGEKIELIVIDDKFDVKLAASNAEVLIKQKNVLALFMHRGTEHVQAILPGMVQGGVPLIAPTSGAILLREPSHKLIFNLRAPHRLEAEKSIAYLKVVGITRIAVVYVDNAFGAEIVDGVRRGFATQGISPTAIVKASVENPDIPGIVGTVIKSDSQTLIWIGASTVVSAGVKALRAAGSDVQVLTFSNNASTGFIKQLGDHARGVIVTQVMPSERNVAYSVIREAQELAKAANFKDLSPTSLEGFMGAKLLVEALRRAGPRPTREGLVKTLNSMRRYDLGGLEITYSPEDHQGLSFVELSILGGDGKFKR